MRHPFIEAEIGKSMLRRIAPLVRLPGLADLPSAPCLSSRIETGLAVEPRALALVHAVERLLTERLSPSTVRCRVRREGLVIRTFDLPHLAEVRCRVRREGLVIELDEAALERLGSSMEALLREEVAGLAAAAGQPPRALRFAPYRTGSAFLRSTAVDRPGVVRA